MHAAYLRNFDGFRRAGGSTFNVWGWVGANDAWANASTIVDRTHPKYRAIVEFAGRSSSAGAPAPLPAPVPEPAR